MGECLEVSAIRPTVKGFFVKRYLLWLPVSVAISASGVLVLLSAPGMDHAIGLSLAAAGALALGATLAHSWLHCRATSLSFDDDRLVYETGILDHRKKKIPIHMITDSSASRTFIEKFFGTGTFNLSTSGSSGYEIVCDGLDYGRLDEMHGALYALIRRFRGAARPPAQDSPGQ